MATPLQNAFNAKARYNAGSAIATRNAALALCKRIDALRAADIGAVQFANHARVTSLADYCADTPTAGAQVDAGREPHLLVADVWNPGCFNAVPIYDSRIDPFEAKSNRCWIDIHQGETLMPIDTLVFWKA